MSSCGGHTWSAVGVEGIISSPRELRKVFIMSGGIQAKTEKVRGVRVMGGVPQGEG